MFSGSTTLSVAEGQILSVRTNRAEETTHALQRRIAIAGPAMTLLMESELVWRCDRLASSMIKVAVIRTSRICQSGGVISVGENQKGSAQKPHAVKPGLADREWHKQEHEVVLPRRSPALRRASLLTGGMPSSRGSS
jgi:hypothetical protein